MLPRGFLKTAARVKISSAAGAFFRRNSSAIESCRLEHWLLCEGGVKTESQSRPQSTSNVDRTLGHAARLGTGRFWRLVDWPDLWPKARCGLQPEVSGLTILSRSIGIRRAKARVYERSSD